MYDYRNQWPTGGYRIYVSREDCFPLLSQPMEVLGLSESEPTSNQQGTERWTAINAPTLLDRGDRKPRIVPIGMMS
jgi:hypothetical protein